MLASEIFGIIRHFEHNFPLFSEKSIASINFTFGRVLKHKIADCANKLGYPRWRSCQKVLLSQWFYPSHIHLPLQIPCKTIIAEEFIMTELCTNKVSCCKWGKSVRHLLVCCIVLGCRCFHQT